MRDLLASRLTCGLRNRDSGASKSSKSPGDCTWPEPHQPLTWLDFCPCRFWTGDFSTRSGLTTHSITDCPTPWGQKVEGHGGGLWSTYVCTGHDIIYYSISRCNHTFDHYLKVSPWLQVKPSQELNLAQRWKTPRFPPLDPTPLGVKTPYIIYIMR